MTIHEYPPRTIRAHELVGDEWFNGNPVDIAGQTGGVVLLLFWDYSCSKSLRLLPYVREWHRKYGKEGLVVVGVHTPKFPFGRDRERVGRAVRRLGIPYPVVTDNGMFIWGRYNVRKWPTVSVIDKEGSVRYVGEGEVNPFATERAVQTMMLGAHMLEESPDLVAPLREEDRPGVVCYRSTPELFGGYARGTVGNVEGTVPESTMAYRDPEIYVDGRLYLDGNWLAGRDALHGEVAENLPSSLIVQYSALEAYGVFMPGAGGPVEVTVQQDGRPLTAVNAGEDVTIQPDGRSTIAVDDARLYHIVRNVRHGDYVLRLTAAAEGLVVYSMTFGASVIPDMIRDS